MKRLFFAFYAILLLGCGNPGLALSDVQALTESGIVEGEKQDGIVVYRGVPFAAPPVGELRWKEPQSVASWQGVRLCTEFGDDPMQPDLFGDMHFLGKRKSEDCLYLNIWAPLKGKDCPVLIYFNGGGLMCGSGSEPRYAGDSLAARGIIAITANYREGVFGYLAHPDLTAESRNHTSGNYGALDQAAAISWVHRNIRAFGGDPTRLTIAGESAGSFSVSALMASPLTRDLLGGAIGSSGAEFYPLGAKPLSQMEAQGKALLETRGGGLGIQALRALSADSLQSLLPPTGMPSLAIDGYFLTETLEETFKAGRQAEIPLLLGWNSMESHPLQLLSGKEPTLRNAVEALSGTFGSSAGNLAEAFGLRSDADVLGWPGIELSGALFTAYPTWKWAELHRSSRQPVYRYKFRHPRPPMAVIGKASGLAGGVMEASEASEIQDAGSSAATPQGAVHSADIEYAMGNLRTNPYYAWTEDDFRVEQTFLDFYTNFIRNADPNGPGLPLWHSMTREPVAPVMQIDVQSREESSDGLEKAYRLLDALYHHE